MRILIITFFSLCFSFNSFAVSEDILKTLPVYSLCKNRMNSREIVRMVRVERGSIENCLTVYSKGGTEKIVGDATNDVSCLKFYNNIKANLKDAGWNCKDLESDAVVIAN